MRFMVIYKGNKASEKGAPPDPQLLAEMNTFIDELIKAGIVLGYEGLHPSCKGARVQFSGKNRTVTEGPFAETKELIAGFMLWQVKSLEEAIEWVKRSPNGNLDEGEVEIRQVFEPEDFAPVCSEEEIEQEKRIRAQLADQSTKK